MRERMEILIASRKNPYLMINSCHEFYGACIHKTQFHMYTNTTKQSTDESQADSKGVDEQKKLEKLTEVRDKERKQKTPTKTICTEIFMGSNISELSSLSSDSYYSNVKNNI